MTSGPPTRATGSDPAVAAAAPVEVHEARMREALELARRGAKGGEVPVGALVVDADGTVVSRAHNRTRELSDPTAHAEALALREAAAVLGDWRLEGHALYATLEPCAMCAGAAILARVQTLVFAAHDPKAGMCGSLANVACDPRLNHRIEVVSGILADDSARLLRDFFRARRSKA